MWPWLVALSSLVSSLFHCGPDFLHGLPPVAHIAHRGGADTAPENTLYALGAAATEYRADILEVDLQRTADGFLVLMHNETVDDTTDGTGRVSDLTLADLQRLDAAHWFDPTGAGAYPLRDRGAGVVATTRAGPERSGGPAAAVGGARPRRSDRVHVPSAPARGEPRCAKRA